MWKKLLVLALLSLPFAAWAFIKPVRVLAPELAGVHCYGKICIDDPARLPEASRLVDEAVSYVQGNIAGIESVPRAIFCSTRACSSAFGFTSNLAYTVGTGAMVFSDRAWRPYLVRHELIHHVQNERFGGLRAWLFKPTWFREGMAYSLSGDPRRRLPELLQGYRATFEKWYDGVGHDRLWTEAARL